MQLGITIPLQKYLNLPKQSYGEPEDLFFCWEIHRILYQGRDMMIAVNANNRFGRHHGFRLEAPSGACRRGGGKRYV